MRKFKIKLTDKNYYIIYADNQENAVKKLRDALINNEISDYQPKELSNSKIEAIPAQAREELNKSNNKRATLLGYESYIEDIIEAADPSIKGSLKSRGNKIISDLKKQFKIEDNEIKDDNNSEYKKELAYWQDLYMNRKLITSSELSAKAAELRKKYNIKDAELTSMNIIEKAKSLGGQVKQNGATGVLGISITSPQRSDEFADWLEENNIHYNSDGRQYYVEIQDSAIKDGKYVINNMNDLKRLFINFPKGDVDISYGRSGFYYHIRPKADGKVSLGSAGYDGTFNTLKEALEWVVYNFRDLILNVNPDGSNRDSAIKDASRNDCRLVLAARGFMPLKENSDHTETWRFREDNLKDFQKQVYEVRMRYPHLIESSSDTRLEIYVDYEWAARDSAIKDADNRIFELGNKRQVVFSTGNFVAMENGVVYDKGFLGGSKYNNGKGWNVDDYIKHLKSLGYKEVNDSAIKDDLSKVENIGKFTLWQDNDTKEYYFDATISRSGKKLHPLGTKDINKAREKVKKELEWITDSAIKDSSDYTINYRNSYTGERNKETIKANSAIEAIKEFADAVALRGWGTRNIDIISISPNDGYVRLYGSLQALLASKEFRDCSIIKDSNELDKYVGKRLKSANDFLTYVEIASNNNYKLSNNSDGTMDVVIPSGRYNIKFKYDREPDKNGDRVQVDKITKISDAEPKNWTYVMFGTTGEKKVDNLTKAEAEHLLKNNKLLGYDGKIFETNLVKDAITYGITPEFKWRKGDIKPERIAYTLDEARYVKDSLERTDRIIYVIFEIETNKIVY